MDKGYMVLRGIDCGFKPGTSVATAKQQPNNTDLKILTRDQLAKTRPPTSRNCTNAHIPSASPLEKSIEVMSVAKIQGIDNLLNTDIYAVFT